MDGFFYICVAHLKYLVSLVCNNSAMAQRHVLVLYEDVKDEKKDRRTSKEKLEEKLVTVVRLQT